MTAITSSELRPSEITKVAVFLNNGELQGIHEVWPGTVNLPNDCYCYVEYQQYARSPWWIHYDPKTYMTTVDDTALLKQLKLRLLLLT